MLTQTNQNVDNNQNQHAISAIKKKANGTIYSNDLENWNVKQGVSERNVHEVREYANPPQFCKTNSSKQKSIQHSLPLPSTMYSNDLKKKKQQEQNVLSSTKKNKLQDTIVDEQLPLPPSLSFSAIPQTIEQARKVYAISSDNIASQNIIEANESIAEKVAELHKLEELQQKLLATENTLKLEVMNYMQLHTYLKKGDNILVSWKSTTRRTFEIPKFKEDFPDLYATYVKEISTQNFRLY